MNCLKGGGAVVDNLLKEAINHCLSLATTFDFHH